MTSTTIKLVTYTMTSFTACTKTEVYDLLELALESGKSIATIAHAFTTNQLATFIDEYFTNRPIKETASTDRTISKGLCCFLYELHQQGKPTHYAKIRDMVKAKYKHMTNDYSTLKYFGLIEKANAGLGHWKVTNLGLSFLNGLANIPAYVTIKNNVVINRSTGLVSIADFEDFNHVSYNPITLEEDTTEI